MPSMDTHLLPSFDPPKRKKPIPSFQIVFMILLIIAHLIVAWHLSFENQTRFEALIEKKEMEMLKDMKQIPTRSTHSPHR